MKEDWTIQTANEFCRFVTDGTHDSPKRVDNGRYLITSKHLQEFNIDFNTAYKISEEDYKKIIIRSGVEQWDIMFSMIGTVGRIYQEKNETIDYAVKNVGLFKMGGDVIKSKWLKYYLQSTEAKEYILGHSRGSTQSFVPLATLRSLPVAAPPQRYMEMAIKTLSALDDKIENNIKTNQTLEKMAQAIFKSWFVDFEPFGGVMPRDWQPVKLSDIVSCVGGYSYSSKELKPSTTAMATIKNFERKGGFKIDGFKEIIVGGKIKPEQYANQFDVLVSHTDITQNADVIGNAEMLISFGGYEKIILSLDLVKVTPKINELSNFVLLAMLKTQEFKGHALGYVNGTTVLHMSKKAIPEYEIMLPSDLSILEKLNALLEPIYRKIANNISENVQLVATRDTLLPRLMSGEIDIPTEGK